MVITFSYEFFTAAAATVAIGEPQGSQADCYTALSFR